MKREFLEGLGLDKSTVDAVIAEHGSGIEALKKRNAELEEQCRALPELKRSISELDKRLEESKKRYGELIDSVITRAVRDAGFSSILAEDAARRLISEEQENGNDIYTVIDALREADPEAFSAKRCEKPFFSAPPLAAVGDNCGDGFTRRRM